MSQKPDDLSPVPRNQWQKEVLIPENYLLTSEHTCVPTPTFISYIYTCTTIIINICILTPLLLYQIFTPKMEKKRAPSENLPQPIGDAHLQPLGWPIPSHTPLLPWAPWEAKKDHTFIIDAAIGILLPRQQLLHLCLAHLLPWGCGNGVVMTRGREGEGENRNTQKA